MTNNPYITDERLEQKRKQAENEINSALAARYVLPLSEVPAIITQVAETLAAGYIAYEEYGGDGEGGKWLGEGRAILKAIMTGKQLLLNSDYTELPRVVSSGRLSGYPNATDTDEAKFGMNDRY